MSNKNIYGKIPTPLVRSIPISGGGFYTFPSAAEDLTLTFSNLNTDRLFRFSKFALLNIPNISYENRPIKKDNMLKFQAFPRLGMGTNQKSDCNKIFMENFQNYCLNLESTILSQDSYDSELPQTVSERIFFKWLKEFGGIRFKNQVDTEENKSLFCEEFVNDQEAIDNNIDYKRVVQYIGEISYAGNQIGNGSTTTEIVIDIPSDCGNTPLVLFNSISDNNYNPGMIFENPNDSDDLNYITGRSINNTHQDGLSMLAQFDCPSIIQSSGEPNDTGKRLYSIPENISGVSVNDTKSNIMENWNINTWWYGNIANMNDHSYYCERSIFSDVTNDYLAIVENTQDGGFQDDFAYMRSRLDGVTIDWNVNDYNSNNYFQTDYNWNTENSTTIQRLGTHPKSNDYQFNAILLYYDLYKSDFDTETNSYTDDVLATNLFGILFIDNVVSIDPTNNESGIKRFYKQKANEETDNSGNEYAFKINLKVDTNTSEVTLTRIPVVSEDNTIAMNLFHDALTQMTELSEYLASVQLSMLSMQERLKIIPSEALQSQLQAQIDIINSRLSSLETLTAKMSTVDSSGNLTEDDLTSIRDYLTELQIKIDTLISGQITATSLLDNGTLLAGKNINFVRNGNILTINSDAKTFNFNGVNEFTYSDLLGSTTVYNNGLSNEYFNGKKYFYQLKSGNNYLRYNGEYFSSRPAAISTPILSILNNTSGGLNLSPTPIKNLSDIIIPEILRNGNLTKYFLNIFIEIDNTQWQTGQCFRFSAPNIADNIEDLTNCGIVIQTRNKLDRTKYDVIKIVENADLTKFKNSGVLEFYYAGNDIFYCDIF